MTWQRFALTRHECRPFLEEGADLQAKDAWVDPAPPWRRFMAFDDYQRAHAGDALERWRQLRGISNERARQKSASFVLPDTRPCRDLVLAVNAALALRRPLLLTGLPGSGKTSLAYVLADWLGLGPVLEWPVSPGASLADALATYDPLARLQDFEIAAKENRPALKVEDFVRLGPVGTAFLPAPLPRVLLIDEVDKGDLNLANELLHLFEEGRFPIPVLQRADREAGAGGSVSTRKPRRQVDTWDETQGEGEQRKPLQAWITSGQVQCHEFPLVVMTSNGERDFPPAFNRRCLRVAMPDFSRQPEALRQIVASQLEREDNNATHAVEEALDIFSKAVQRQQGEGDVLATDQLLNLAFLMNNQLPQERSEHLAKVLLQGLNSDLPVDPADVPGDEASSPADDDDDGGR